MPELIAPTTTTASSGGPAGRMPTLYLSHGAPPLIDDPIWPTQLAQWSANLPRPRAILVASAHWEAAPVTIGATTPVPLVYDFWGFPQRFYDVRYDAPGAPDLAARVAGLLSSHTPVYQDLERGLDHGAYVPLTVMYPDADIPVLQMSMPSEDPQALLEIGRLLAPLRDEGVLIIGSGFMTHSFDAIHKMQRGATGIPNALLEFDAWAAEALARKDVDSLIDYHRRAPGVAYAHPTVDHFVPLFISLGAGLDREQPAQTQVDGYWMTNSKRSVQFG